MKKNILITGAAGFIGFHLTKKLSEKGLKIVGLDIKHYRMFKDHHRYNSQTLNSLLSEINELNIKSVITTEKDVIKLPKWFIKEINLFILQVEFVFSPQAEKILLEEVKKVLQ